MWDKRIHAKFSLELAELLEENGHELECFKLLSAMHLQKSALLSPDLFNNAEGRCPRCKSTHDHLIEQIPPFLKKQKNRLRQIQKLRKIKKRTSKQNNLLRKLLNRKNGFQRMTCKVCNYVQKRPISTKDKS